ncbi:hypothetical protein [Peptoniphilus asaccharolyticus]|uniref:hypothetical protein n=1 Tax=Peptoniphilus asaccharolyticus TaxID=1258 RepID=UPI0013562BF5|nr:hypothetical protein [Peptoniphilus asaccharolyticus]
MAKSKSDSWVFNVYLSVRSDGEYIEMEVITKKSPNKAGKHLKDLVNISMLIIA